jgi:hypothetical protein
MLTVKVPYVRHSHTEETVYCSGGGGGFDEAG